MPTFVARAALKTSMNSRPMILRLRSGSVTPLSFARKRRAASTNTTLRCSRSAKRLRTCARLVLAQQAVVHEDAGEPVADRRVDEERRHRGVDAAGERADARARLAHLSRGSVATALLDERGGVPVAAAAAGVEEVGEDPRPLVGVLDLGVEQDPEEPARSRPRWPPPGVARWRRRPRTRGRAQDRVAVAHPDARARREAVEQEAVLPARTRRGRTRGARARFTSPPEQVGS